MKTYEIHENYSQNWGLWSAASADEATQLLKDDVANNPQKYNGVPDWNEIETVEI